MSKFNFNIDIEDVEIQSSLFKSKCNSISQKKFYDLEYHTVDLDLPSGTRWCKYNLDVNPNQLSNPEDWYGDYYAWGEIKAKRISIGYAWDTYRFAKNGSSNDLTKYITDSNFSAYDKRVGNIVDNLTELLPEDDAAYQNMHVENLKFHIPTKEQFEELLEYTKNYWVINYDPNKMVHNLKDDDGIRRLNGRVFEGRNRNQLFIPATGYCHGSRVSSVGSYSSLWSSSLNLSRTDYAYFLGLDFGGAEMGSCSRCTGYQIRPVIKINL